MKALLLVDIQNDFLPGGALAVPQGDETVSYANKIMSDYDLVVATQDWHPADHMSFASRHQGKSVGDTVELDGLEQILWPVHCVQESKGAEFAPGLDPGRFDVVFRKGMNPRIDSYSGFFDNARRSDTGLRDYLIGRLVDEVHVMGLATEYCVKFTALDSVELGYPTVLLTEGIRGVELNSGDCDRAIEQMRSNGVEIC